MPVYCIELTVKITFIQLLGHWLEDSGWTSALVQAEIASSGTADSFIKATDVTKTRHAREVTAACLYALIRRASTDYSTSVGPNQNEDDEEVALSFQKSCSMQANKCVHFDYWMKTLSSELLLLVFIRSIRESNFDMYVESLAEIVTWFFALDHTHYSRWLSVHIRDMMMLSKKNWVYWQNSKQENLSSTKLATSFLRWQ